jgi:hypothetical protein
MKYSGEHRDVQGEEKSLAPWLERIGLKLVPFLAVAALITLFLTQGVLIALTAFLLFAVLYYLGSWFIKVFKKIR